MEENNHWHLDKRISWGHVATTVSIAVAAVFFFTNMDKRVDGNSKDIVSNTKTIAQIQAEDKRHEDEAKEQMQRLEAMMNAQTTRLEGRMEAQYNEIIRRLEMLNAWAMRNQSEDSKSHSK